MCESLPDSLFGSNVQSVKSTGAASIFLYVQQDTAGDRIVLLTEITSEKIYFLLKSTPIFKAIDSKKNGDFYRPECKLLNGTVLLWILENGDVSCFNMRTVLTLTVIKWILLNWCVVHSNLGLAHV